MKPCVRDTTARSLGYAAYLPHELPRQARKAARWRLFPRLASAARACGCRSARLPARQLDWVNWRPPKKPLPVLMLQLPLDSHCASRSHTPPLATLPDDHEEWLRCRLAEVLAERWWPVRWRWWCLTAPSRAVRGSTDAGAHDGVPNNLLECRGIWGNIRMGAGGWPILHAATTQRMGAPFGRGPAVHRGGCEPVRSTESTEQAG
jgi:hypothetical protein